MVKAKPGMVRLELLERLLCTELFSEHVPIIEGQVYFEPADTIRDMANVVLVFIKPCSIEEKDKG